MYWPGCKLMFSSGNVTNCNFTKNSARYSGGAITFMGEGNVTDCNFTNNTASVFGGAVYFFYHGEVTNCNFTNNSAGHGGAIRFGGEGKVSKVTNCNFTSNSARCDGGAIRFGGEGNVRNCNFNNNTASEEGGAIYSRSNGIYDISGCSFNGNIASSGSAIYTANKPRVSIYNSSFLKNRANADTLIVNLIGSNIEIIFKGQDNLINAIYANDTSTTFSFYNVEFWSKTGVSNTDNQFLSPQITNAEAGQNIRVNVIVNDKVFFKWC